MAKVFETPQDMLKAMREVVDITYVHMKMAEETLNREEAALATSAIMAMTLDGIDAVLEVNGYPTDV